jgi:hypothetical protein
MFNEVADTRLAGLFVPGTGQYPYTDADRGELPKRLNYHPEPIGEDLLENTCS